MNVEMVLMVMYVACLFLSSCRCCLLSDLFAVSVLGRWRMGEIELQRRSAARDVTLLMLTWWMIIIIIKK